MLNAYGLSLVYTLRKKFCSRAYFCLFEENFECKKFAAYSKKFLAYIKTQKNARVQSFLRYV